MNLIDLQHIFQEQLSTGEPKLYFMLVDNGHKAIIRHPAVDLVSAVPMFSAFTFAGDEGRMPRFTKQAPSMET